MVTLLHPRHTLSNDTKLTSGGLALQESILAIDSRIVSLHEVYVSPGSPDVPGDSSSCEYGERLKMLEAVRETRFFLLIQGMQTSRVGSPKPAAINFSPYFEYEPI